MLRNISSGCSERRANEFRASCSTAESHQVANKALYVTKIFIFNLRCQIEFDLEGKERKQQLPVHAETGH